MIFLYLRYATRTSSSISRISQSACMSNGSRVLRSGWSIAVENNFIMLVHGVCGIGISSIC